MSGCAVSADHGTALPIIYEGLCSSPIRQAAAAALEVARAEVPLLVVLDIKLPDRSGYEALRQLRAELGERLPVLFVSGVRVEPYDRAAGLLVGGDDYLVKPFAADEFLARVRALLRRTDVHVQPPDPAHRA